MSMNAVGLALVMALHGHMAVPPNGMRPVDAGNARHAERTYLSQIQPVNDCPAGLTRVSLESRLNPHAHAAGQGLRRGPTPAAGCADLSGISAHERQRGYVRVHEIHSRYIGVPRSHLNPLRAPPVGRRAESVL